MHQVLARTSNVKDSNFVVDYRVECSIPEAASRLENDVSYFVIDKFILRRKRPCERTLQQLVGRGVKRNKPAVRSF